MLKKSADELREALMKPNKSEGDINRLKNIFKENPILRQIPPNQRAEFCHLMKLKDLAPLEVCITEKDKKPDLYIVLSGKLHVKNRAKEDYFLDPFQIFGYTKLLDHNPWTPSKVTSRENSILVQIPRKRMKRAMEKVKKIQDNARLLEFLVKTVPGVRQLGQAGKEKVLSYFESCKFKNGDALIREGEICSHAFIIEEGECKLVSSRHPVRRPESAPSKGLMSRTTSCYNFGLAASGEWVGEDSIILNKPIEFSVIAATSVKALKISKERFSESLARETQNTLKANLENKLLWREQRKKNISQTIMKNVYAEEGVMDQETYSHTEKNYPIATKSALFNIRKIELEKTDFNVKQMLAMPNARQSPKRSLSPLQELITSGQMTIPVSPIESPINIMIRPKTNASTIRPNSGLRPSSSNFSQRPISAYTASFGNRPISALTSFGTRPISAITINGTRNLTHALSLNNLINEKPEKPLKTKLYSACTLGFSLVPTMTRTQSLNSMATPTASNQIPAVVDVKDRFGYTKLEIEDPNETYAQKIRKGRPASPNPVEVWAKKYSLNL